MSKFNFTCPLCASSIALRAALPGEQVRCPECNFLFDSPPPVDSVRLPTQEQTTEPSSGSSPTTLTGTKPPAFPASSNTPPPLPTVDKVKLLQPESPLLGKARNALKPKPGRWGMGEVGDLAIKIGAFTLILIIIVTIVIVVLWKARDEFDDIQNQISPSTHSNAKQISVTIDAGDVIIIDDTSRVSSVEISCNNGLIIKADWRRDPNTELGYSIYEPTVSRTTNHLAVMLLARGVIVDYLNGEYD